MAERKQLASSSSRSFVDKEGDESTFKLANGRLQWWANGRLEMDHVQALSFDMQDAMGPTLRVPGNSRLVASIVRPSGRELQDLITSIHMMARSVGVNFARAPDFVDKEGDCSTIRLAGGRIQWWANGSFEDYVSALEYDPDAPMLKVPGHGRLIAVIKSPTGSALDETIEAVRRMARSAGVDFAVKSAKSAVSPSFVDAEGDRSTIKLVNGVLQWWANNSIELDRIPALEFDPQGPTLKVPGNGRLIARIQTPKGRELARLMETIQALARRSGVQFTTVHPNLSSAEFVDREGDRSSIKLIGGTLQWWANGRVELDRVPYLHFNRDDPRGPTLKVPGDPRLVAGIVSHTGKELDRLIASIREVAEIAGVEVEQLSGRSRTATMYHGTSRATADKIQKDGFKPSSHGELGPGAYFVDEENPEKAKRFAHDDFHRSRGTVWATSENEPVLIECTVTVRRPYVCNSSDSTWQAKGHDSCWTSKTRVSSSSEWCVIDPNAAEILAIHNLRVEDCPWGSYCPYENKTSTPGTPWGGRCPCRN